MERIYIIMALFAINILYWADLSRQWHKLSDDGAGWRATIGVIIIIVTVVLMFNLDYILNHHAE